MNRNPAPRRLRILESLLLGSLTFGLFFGAGNLIFPVSLGLQAGTNVVPAALGFLAAAVGIPVLGVIATATAGTRSLPELASRVHPIFSTVFTCALYLTIGPFFAIPRTATVSYEIAFGSSAGNANALALAIFSLVFFILVLCAALRPGRILDIVGKYLTPIFLVLLGALLVAAFLAPAAPLPGPVGAYASHAAAQGILDGYNTMDGLASLAFAIIVIDSARKLGVTSKGRIAAEVTKAGAVAAVAMGAIYLALAVLGSRMTELVARDTNGAVALATMSRWLFGSTGHVLAALIMFVACLKTAIGLVVASTETFSLMFPRLGSQRRWAIGFTLWSLVMANLGLDTIIQAAVPVLQLLYPMAIVIIVLGLLDRFVAGKAAIHWMPVLLAGLASLATVLVTADWLPSGGWTRLLPGFDLGFGWVLPAAVGFLVGGVVSVWRRSPSSQSTR